MNDQGATREPTESRAAQGIEHLQAAAHEMIAAARAFLDAIEAVVDDEEKLGSITEAVGSVARGAARGLRSDPGEPVADDPADPVEHIRVS